MLRLLGKLFRPGPGIPVADAADIEVESAGFDGNLAPGDDTVQKVAQKVDGLQLAAEGISLPEYLQSDTEVLHSRAGALFWEGINEVPDTPGEASGVGHVLTVVGEGDKDYAFRAPAAAPGGGADQTARDAAAAARAVADAATTPAEAMVIANARARARFTDAEKTKLGNLDDIDQTARDAAAAARSVADVANTRANDNTREIRIARGETAANKAIVDRLSVFEHYELDPGGISGTDFPEFIALKCSRKIIAKTISMIVISLGGQNVGNIVRNTSPVPPATDPAAPFNNGVPELSGGIINCVLTTQARQNLKNSVGVANRSPQFIGVNVTVTFTDGTSMSDLMHFGTNNNAFDLARNPEFTSDVTTIANARAAAVAGPVLVVSSIASFDAAANRFEDSDGDEVVVPDGSIVILTQAIYDAAVADAQFIPNPMAIFLTR